MDRRREEKIVKALMIGSLAIVLGSLFAVVALVLGKGLPALSWSMITQLPQGGYFMGKGGGILNAIVGSLYLGLFSTMIAFAISLPAALALQKDSMKNTRLAYSIGLALDVLWGTPSIVYGAFAFTVMVYLGLRTSLLGGVVVLTLLELPIMVRAMQEVVRLVPEELKDASYALGATRFETTVRIVVKQAMPGILTGALLAFGRGIGDAASILFTSGYTDRLPNSPMAPVASLPLSIFFQLNTPYPEVQQRAYASALVLLIIVLGLSLVTRALSRKFMKNIVK